MDDGISDAEISETGSNRVKSLIELCLTLNAEAAAARQFFVRANAINLTHELHWGKAEALAKLSGVLEGAVRDLPEFHPSPTSVREGIHQKINDRTGAHGKQKRKDQTERVILSVNRSQSVVVCAAILRGRSQPPFSEAEIGIAQATFGSKWWIAGSAYADLTSDLELPSRAREVLKLLLQTGRNEKEIARKMQISHHTVHVYVKRIYSRYGVGSRAELLSQLLRPSVE